MSDVESDESAAGGASYDDEDSSDCDLSADLPVLKSIVSLGSEERHATELGIGHGEEEEREAIKRELSSLSFEELQKLKEKLGSKKFNETMKGGGEKKERQKEFKRANSNRPREMSSKSRKIEQKVAVQVKKVFRNDPRFDSMCGEFNEKKFYKHYDFVNKMKEDEVEKLKEELKEETNPRRAEKIKYLIQRMENQIRSAQKRKEEDEKQKEERQIQIDAMKEGKSPFFATKAAKRTVEMRNKFDKLKQDGKLDTYMAKKRKQNAQRDRKHLPGRATFNE